MLRIPLPDASKFAKIAFTGHQTCESAHNPNIVINGLTYPGLGLIGIMDFGSAAAEIETTVHEFGHLLGAPDHYGIGGAPSTDIMNATVEGNPFSQNCIYGENKEKSEVRDDLMICDGCKAMILANILMFSHN